MAGFGGKRWSARTPTSSRIRPTRCAGMEAMHHKGGLLETTAQETRVARTYINTNGELRHELESAFHFDCGACAPSAACLTRAARVLAPAASSA
jgi:hypothetical protein